MKMYLAIAAFVAALASSLPLPISAAGAFSEEAVTVPVAVGQISGTLTVPRGGGPFPGVFIIAGSVPTDRDGNSAMLKRDMYKKLAYALAARGIASLRYDKRGIGASFVRQTESAMRLSDFVDDALALTALLGRDRRFSSISIVGHSEGSLIGMLAAERDPHIRSFVSLEGAGRNLAEIINEQVRANPANPPQIVKEVKDIDASLLAGKTVPAPDPLLAALFRPSVQPYLISEFKYDPAKEIAKLTIPVLIVRGTTDLQVSNTDATLLAAADPHATFAPIYGMNHLLVEAPADRAGNLPHMVTHRFRSPQRSSPSWCGFC